MIAAVLLAFVLGARAADAPKANTETMQEAYDQAFQLFQAGDYRHAISKWNDILHSDPSQASARQMIERARKAIAEQVRRREAKVDALIDAGKYRSALLQMQGLIDLDPSDAHFRALQKRLDEVVQLVPELPADGGKAWHAAGAGLRGFLGSPPNLKLAFNGLRYASELAPQEPAFGKLLDVFRELHPDFQEEQVTPGMTWMEYKRLVALHDIYDARYYAAVDELQDVLALEPDDLVALKRLGSAFFAMGRKAQARAAWAKALRLTPNDPTLKSFLAKVR